MTAIAAATRRDILMAGAATLGLAACGRGGAGSRAAQLAELDATAQADLIAKGEATPLELVDAAIERLNAFNPTLNVLVAENFERARARAKAPLPEGPFRGVPFLIKDLMEYPGLVFKQGSQLYAGRIGEDLPALAEAQEKAGLIILGKTTTPEFGLTATTEPVATGITRNPWNTGVTTGGSSGGAAAAVAAGLVPFAHASDGGGSIRIPASCCGLFGFKPSRGRVIGSADPADKVTALSVDHCVSRSVRDSARLLAATERRDAGAPFHPLGAVTRKLDRRLRIGVVTRSLAGAEPEAEVADALQATARLCKDLRHDVAEVDWPFDGPGFGEVFTTLWGAGANAIIAGYEAQSGKTADDSVFETLTLALAARFRERGDIGLAEAIGKLQAVSNALEAQFRTLDVLLSPTVARLPPPIGELDPMRPFAEQEAALATFVGYTPPMNVAGMPAMSVPLYWSKQRLPIGMQFAAWRGEDETLLRLALQLEEARPWDCQRPPIWAGLK